MEQEFLPIDKKYKEVRMRCFSWGQKKSSPIVLQPPALIQYGSMTRVYFLFDISKSNIVNLKNKKKSQTP